MKRLLLFLIIFGAFFCFIKTANAGTYQNAIRPLFTCGADWAGSCKTTSTGQTTFVNNIMVIPEKSGVIQDIQISTWGTTGYGIKWQFAQMATATCLARGAGTFPATYTGIVTNTTEVDMLFPINQTVIEDFPYCLSLYSENTTNKWLDMFSSSSTYPDINAQWYYPALANWYNGKIWVKYHINEQATGNFTILYPSDGQYFPYGTKERLEFTCFNTTSEYAIYYDDQYLNAKEEDFTPCQTDDLFIEDGMTISPYVSEEWWPESGGDRKVVILDKNYLTMPNDVYKRELSYIGVANSQYQRHMGLVCPEKKTSYDTYLISSTPSSSFIQGYFTSLDPVLIDDINVYWRNGSYGSSATWTLGYTVDVSSSTLFKKDIVNDRFVFNILVTSTDFNEYYLDMDGLTYLSFMLEGAERVDVPQNNRCQYSSFEPNVPTTTPVEFNCRDECSNYTWGIKDICFSACDLIIPVDILNGKWPASWYNLRATIMERPPLGYFFVYTNELKTIASSTATTTNQWAFLSNWNFLTQIRTFLGYLVYIFAFGFIFNTFRKNI